MKNQTSDKHLYSAFVKINPDEPFRFELDEMEIEKVYPDGTIETKRSYFTSSISSTCYFGGTSGNKLGVEYKISDYCFILYSDNRNDCCMFLERKRMEVESMINKMWRRFRESKIEMRDKNFVELKRGNEA